MALALGQGGPVIEVLVLGVADCPGVDALLPRLRALLGSCGVPTDLRVVRVEGDADAHRLDFAGSPTVRVDGVDVEPDVGRPGGGGPGGEGPEADHSPGVSCRLYSTSAGVRDAPPEGWVLAALGRRVVETSPDEHRDDLLVRGPRPAVPALVAHDPAWAARFAEHRDRIVGALGARARLVEHIGSTAVAGLAAKPVVDVVVGVDDPDDEDAYLPALVAAGYEVRVSEPGHRALRGGGPQAPVNVHCYAPDADEVEHYRLLRDRLRASPDDRRCYEDAKRALAGRAWPDMDRYAAAKGPVIRAVLAAARGERAQAGR